MPLSKAIAFAIAVGAAAAPSAHAQVHRCTDAAGHSVYSDTPCAQGQSSKLIERPKSATDLAQERAQSDAATQRKYRDQAAERAGQNTTPAEPGPTSAPAPVVPLAASPACKSAQKELEFVSSIRTISQDEKRMRSNAAITGVNAACGTQTPLMQEPPKVVLGTQPHITHCDTGFCYDAAGGLYRKTAADAITAADGRICRQVAGIWTCS